VRGARRRRGGHPQQRDLPAIIDTELMDRFTGGTEAGRRGIIVHEPVGRMDTP
jgi:hypothetical protein